MPDELGSAATPAILSVPTPGVSELFQCPRDAVAVLVLAHGAGAGARHRSLQAIADALERYGIGSLRFDFPFIEAGRKRVDPPDVSIAAIAEAYQVARAKTSLPVWIGGHSFGGRMATHAVANARVEPHGLVLYSFPLHQAGKPDTSRARHLGAILRPMLFVSGTRDALAERALLEPMVESLGNAEVHWLDTADHGYRILRRARRASEDVFDEIARVTRAFVDRHA